MSNCAIYVKTQKPLTDSLENNANTNTEVCPQKINSAKKQHNNCQISAQNRLYFMVMYRVM
jgi:hypothetical protein